MLNLALNKNVEEAYENSEVVTNGEILGYTGKQGYCHFPWPGTLTVDLGENHPMKCIRFLLWDGLGLGSGRRDRRQYHYRILTSLDHKTWTVLYSTEEQGYNGWQVFHIPEGIPARFIRIHGLCNSANRMFHVVELQAFAEEPERLDADIVLERAIGSNDNPAEIDESLPIQRSFQLLIGQLERVIEENPVVNPVPFQDVMQKLKFQVRDVAALETNIESIKRHITDPVQRELEKASIIGLQSLRLGRFSFWGFWIGLIGGVLAIISITLNLLAR